jgi:hypothetical protein
MSFIMSDGVVTAFNHRIVNPAGTGHKVIKIYPIGHTNKSYPPSHSLHSRALFRRATVVTAE